MAKTSREQLLVDGRNVSLSNLEKIMFPGTRIRKADVIDYYIRIADFILPHLRDRPVTLKRFPDGAMAGSFYEKDAPAYTPDWVQTFGVPRRESKGKIRYILVNDLATLVWIANLASLEIHPFLHRIPHIDRPQSVVFDLDPGEGADILNCAHVALLIRELLEGLKLKSFVKGSGSKGLQVYVPLNGRTTYETSQPFAKSIAETLANEYPRLVVPDMAKRLRKDKVFIDWSQNADFKSTVSVYSLRAKSPQPFVSMPITWVELETAVKRKRTEGLYFGIDDALKRVKKHGDLFAEVLTLKQQLPRSSARKAQQRIPPAVPLRRNGRSPNRNPQGRPPESLQTYARKRNFSSTAEPAPTPIRSRRAKKGSRFVVQKHSASHLHYDFRLEMDDVLKSWAIPKGPPLEKGERRLAMPTEDHPLEYLQFEGVIPKGQYGGGTVMVWDIGTYELVEGDYRKGRLRIRLDGTKLKGEWELVRWPKKEKRETWLLIKAAATMPPISRKRDDSSALSRRSMKQIADAANTTWKSNR